MSWRHHGIEKVVTGLCFQENCPAQHSPSAAKSRKSSPDYRNGEPLRHPKARARGEPLRHLEAEILTGV
jgi:hypothetical protein